MSYRDWEEDPRNRRGRHSAPDRWLASDDTGAGQPGRRRRADPPDPYPEYDGTGDLTDTGSRYPSSSPGRRSAEPDAESRGWSLPDRLDDTGAWTRGAHTGEWQQPDEGWPARPEPASAPPAPYLPAPWTQRAALEPAPDDSWPTRATDRGYGEGGSYGDGDPYRAGGYPPSGYPPRAPERPGSSRDHGSSGYAAESYEPRSQRYEPRTYGRPALPSAEPTSSGPATPGGAGPPGAYQGGAYSGEVLPRGHPADRRRPDQGRTGSPYPASPYREPGSPPRDPYRDGPEVPSYRGERDHGGQRRYRDEPAHRDQAAYRQPPTYRELRPDDRPTQRALPAYRESYQDAAPAYRAERPRYREEPRYGDADEAPGRAAGSGVAEYRRGAAPEYGGSGRRPVAALPPGQRRPSVYDVDSDDDEFDEEPEPGGYTASMVYTMMWYAVPMVLWVLWSLTLNSEASANCVDDAGVPCSSERTEALSALVENMPRMGGTLLLSIGVALLLRRISTSWKAATVGFAAAVVGGGLATVGASVITGQPLG